MKSLIDLDSTLLIIKLYRVNFVNITYISDMLQVRIVKIWFNSCVCYEFCLSNYELHLVQLNSNEYVEVIRSSNEKILKG